MTEHVTRGQMVRVAQKIGLRHPRGLTKVWVYSLLRPLVEGLEADLKEAGVLPPAKPGRHKAEKQI